MMLPGLSRSTETINANFTNVRIPRISKVLFVPFANSLNSRSQHATKKEARQASLRKPYEGSSRFISPLTFYVKMKLFHS